MVNAAWYALLKLWIALAGDGTVAVRVPAVLFSAATLPAVFETTVLLAGRRAAWYATALLATCYPFLVYAVVARAYAPALFGVALASYGFVRICGRADRLGTLAYVAGVAIAASFHVVTLFFVVVQLATLPLLRPSPTARRALGIALCGAAVPVAMVVFAVAHEGGGQIDAIPATWPVVRGALRWLGGGLALTPAALWWLSAALVACGLAVAVRSRLGLAIAAWLVLPLLLVVAVAPLHSFFIPRYVRFAVFPGAMLGGIALAALDRRARLAALAVLIAFSTSSVVRAAREPYFDWRGLVNGIEQRAHPGDAVVVDSGYAGDAYRAALRARGGGRTPLVYPTQPISTLLTPATAEPFPDATRLAAAHPRLWIVIWAPTTGGFVSLQHAKRAYRTTTVVPIARFSVALLER